MGLFEALLLRRVTLLVVRMIRRLLIFLGVLAALGIAGNVVAGNVAERKAAEQVKKSLKVNDTPTVRFDAFPILLRLVQGELPGATVDAHDVTVRGLAVARFHLEVEGLKVSLSDLTGGRGRLTVKGGSAYGEVTDEAANAYLARQKETARVEFVDDEVRVRSRIRYAGRDREVEGIGTLSIVGTDLVFTPQTVTVDGGPPPAPIAARARAEASFRVPIPALPGGVRPKTVTVRDGEARLDVEFDRTTLDLNKL